MIEIRNVSKRYGKQLANENISINVAGGEIAVLLGPNGAGKSTLIKCVCGLLRFSGSIMIGGFDNRTSQAKRLLGYVPEMPAMYGMLTVSEHLEFIAKAYRINYSESRAQELLARFELDDKAKKLGKELSKGMQQKLSICCALLHEPKAIIFDEPLVGLDPHAIREFKLLIGELKSSGTGIIISTHMIESIEDNWDTTYIMQNGKVRAACKKTELDNTSLKSLFFSITEGAEPETKNIQNTNVQDYGGGAKSENMQDSQNMSVARPENPDNKSGFKNVETEDVENAAAGSAAQSETENTQNPGGGAL